MRIWKICQCCARNIDVCVHCIFDAFRYFLVFIETAKRAHGSNGNINIPVKQSFLLSRLSINLF